MSRDSWRRRVEAQCSHTAIASDRAAAAAAASSKGSSFEPLMLNTLRHVLAGKAVAPRNTGGPRVAKTAQQGGGGGERESGEERQEKRKRGSTGQAGGPITNSGHARQSRGQGGYEIELSPPLSLDTKRSGHAAPECAP